MSQPVEQPRRTGSASRTSGAATASVGTPVATGTGASGPVSETPLSAKPPTRAAGQRPSRKSQRRHARVVIRKVGPWSVFKMSIIFYFCVMLVLLGAGVILYGMLGAIGALDSTTRLIRDLFADQLFVINGRWLFTRGLVIGLAMVFIWSLINVFVAFLYNLISDLVGGVEVTLAERR
jgi:hypothetical protein